MEARILVTGAGGFIGRRLVERLKGRAPLRVLVRRPVDFGPDVETVAGDVLDAAAVRRAMRDVGVVYHLAGLARAWARDAGEFHRVNVGGLDHVLRVAADTGGVRVIHTSTVLTLLPFNDAPVQGVRARPTPYEISKRAADQLVATWAADGLDVLTVHPTRVFGPGPLHDANGATKLMVSYLRGLVPVRLADGGVHGNYVHVDDVVEGMMLAGSRGRAGRRYTLGGENLTLSDFLGLVAEASGVRRRTLAVPVRLAALVGTTAELWGRVGGSPFITRGWIRTYLQDHAVGIEATSAELGYRPQPVAVGIQRTVEWLAAAGIVRLAKDPRFA